MVAGAAVWCSTQCPSIPSLSSAFQRGLVLARCGETGSVIYSSWEYKFGQLFAGQCSNICQIFKDIPSMVANSRPVNSWGPRRALNSSPLVSISALKKARLPLLSLLRKPRRRGSSALLGEAAEKHPFFSGPMVLVVEGAVLVVHSCEREYPQTAS